MPQTEHVINSPKNDREPFMWTAWNAHIVIRILFVLDRIQDTLFPKPSMRANGVAFGNCLLAH